MIVLLAFLLCLVQADRNYPNVWDGGSDNKQQVQNQIVMSNKTKIAVSALTSIMSATGEMKKDGNKAYGQLTLTTGEDGPISLSLAEFDAIYAGMVRCWPAVKPLKDQVIAEQRVLAAVEKEAKKAEIQAAKDADKLKVANERKAKLEAKKAEKEAKKAELATKAKAKKDAEAKKAADAKVKEKAKKDAAIAKAKADKEAKAKKAADAKAAAKVKQSPAAATPTAPAA